MWFPPFDITKTPVMKTLKITHDASTLTLEYEPKTDRAIYDICDLMGNVVFSGTIKDHTTRIDISGIQAGEYLLLVLDGDEIAKERVKIKQN